ncbi:MAG: hypothetical protein PHU86_03955 [Patescibacteria group bacterium]|nr:hypothetical protein [Patescibacteria group bacterium]
MRRTTKKIIANKKGTKLRGISLTSTLRAIRITAKPKGNIIAVAKIILVIISRSFMAISPVYANDI